MGSHVHFMTFSASQPRLGTPWHPPPGVLPAGLAMLCSVLRGPLADALQEKIVQARKEGESVPEEAPSSRRTSRRSSAGPTASEQSGDSASERAPATPAAAGVAGLGRLRLGAHNAVERARGALKEDNRNDGGSA